MHFKKAIVFLHDLLVAGLAWLLAFHFRFNFSIPDSNKESLLWSLVIVVSVQGVVFWGFGLYRSLWRFASLPDLRRIVLAVLVSTLAFVMALFLYRRLEQVPRSVLLLDPILLITFMGGSRFLYRSWKDGHLIPIRKLSATPVLVLGAGQSASRLLRELFRGSEWEVVGLLDDDPQKKGRMLSGVTVLGAVSELAGCAKKYDVTQVILAMPSASPWRRRTVVEAANAAGLTVLTVPRLEDLLTGRLSVSQIRRVELEDLLGRGRVKLDEAGLHGLLTNRAVLVTGAGGSIGSELCRQIARFSPSKLMLLESNEFALYRIEQEFFEHFPSIPIIALSADVRDPRRLDELFQRFSPQVVFHAAAYKHVPLMENDNCWEAVRNNVLGTLNTAHAAIRQGVEKFVFISSDKAVNPTNVMGATKRLAEMVCQGLHSVGKTQFVVVRFGNVLGSTGSVIPKFKEQIARGGPLTVTHPDMTRYFMLIPEAAQLVLQAGLMGKGGELFVLDMGSPVKILDLAQDMIRLSGFKHDEIKIVFTGLRAGEKIKEELLADEEKTLPTHHSKVRIARAREVSPTFLNDLCNWIEQTPILSDEEVKRGLRDWIPEYSFERAPQPPRHR
ncbi:MAG: polysaccharide biosynthesis protein [Elusimicrobia bacterium]|nr:polysaccharide biosynthesis protein [Elusimicrobiota bacterium]